MSDTPSPKLPVHAPTVAQFEGREPVPEQPATPRQLRYLQAVAREAGYDSAGLDNRAQQEFGCNANQLSRRDASTLIDLVMAEIKTWGNV